MRTEKEICTIRLTLIKENKRVKYNHETLSIFGFQTKMDSNRVSEKIYQAGVLGYLHISFLVLTENCADLPSNFMLLHSVLSSLK